MFTIKQIKEAHTKVKSGADFPAYVQDLIQLGVKKYDTYLSNGQQVYFGENDFNAASESNGPLLTIAPETDEPTFRHYLKIHQQGETDYATFCQHAAETGVYKWTVDFQKMTCTYFDKSGNEILLEKLHAI